MLSRVHSVQHVNALAEGEELTFDKIGLTVIYGDNGSGKSGYARVLKRACRARIARGETVLQNIYATESGTPTAALDFSVNGTNRSATWILDRGGDPLLSAINVFDSKTANVHVDQTNDVAYTPLPLKILATLAIACGDVKERIVKDIRKLKDQTPAVIAKPTCQLGTRVGKLLNALATAKPDDVRTLATLAADDKARLVTLKTELSADPARMNRQLLSLKARLDRNTTGRANSGCGCRR